MLTEVERRRVPRLKTLGIVILLVIIAAVGALFGASFAGSPHTGGKEIQPTLTTATASSSSQSTATFPPGITTATSTSTRTQQTVTLFPISNNAPIFQSSFERHLSNPHSAAPVGIASYGLYDESGSLKGYVIKTNEVVAKATIYSLKAFNASQPPDPYGNAQYGAGLQFNVMLGVTTASGNQSIWLQNVATFNTNTSEVLAPFDYIANLTTVTAGLQASGSGHVVNVNPSHEYGQLAKRLK